ncbi:hypothetical protein IB655_08875 [Francisella noatunensis]|uniref:Uncharacterized protein n=4 Tax=Francisella noatunensis TaxID=657445 RepID=A0A9Q2KU10_9GAMM|nr:hypothetical protein [Francisella noatunensis]MBK2029383.1 hypothetical protein [Francisella noatunensis]MBK2033999.1 hypothetical protein [Francisella noatunensis]MBK2049412.1 hypothetical protein [Francisella noatunensis]MBK2052312.1 hypothetical protein [Francisella noatunensis]MBK2053751.1 hypothetical protein [Francisella noatunensis]
MVFNSYYELDSKISPDFAEIIKSVDFYFNEKRALTGLINLAQSMSNSDSKRFVDWNEYFRNVATNFQQRLSHIEIDRQKTYAIIIFGNDFSKLLNKLEYITRPINISREEQITTSFLIQIITIIKGSLAEKIKIPNKKIATTAPETITKSVNLIFDLYKKNKFIFDKFIIPQNHAPYIYQNNNLYEKYSLSKSIVTQKSKFNIDEIKNKGRKIGDGRYGVIYVYNKRAYKILNTSPEDFSNPDRVAYVLNEVNKNILINAKSEILASGEHVLTTDYIDGVCIDALESQIANVQLYNLTGWLMLDEYIPGNILKVGTNYVYIDADAIVNIKKPHLDPLGSNKWFKEAEATVSFYRTKGLIGDYN